MRIQKSMLQLLIDTVRLDIYDLNYAYGSERLGTRRMALPPKEGSFKLGVITRILSFFFHLLKSVQEILEKDINRLERDAVIFFVSSINQKNSLAPVAEKIKKSYLVGGSSYNPIKVQVRFPLSMAFCVSLLFFPIVLLNYIKSKEYRRETYKFIFDQYWLTYGYYFTAWFWLDRLKPNLLVVANDHSMETRVVTQVASEKKIPTIYIQHASVTEDFPALKFDYAFLEGYDALTKYAMAGPSDTKVFLTGMAKFDSHYHFINKNKKVSKVGICLNLRDPETRVFELCDRLMREPIGLSYTIRPHPGDKRRDTWLKLASKYGIALSDPRVEISFEFIQRQDAIIVGNSNIILEAVLLNVFPLYYDFNESNTDWYGFIKNGLVEYSSAAEDVMRQLRSAMITKPFIRDKAKVYCASVGTTYDGCSSKLTAELILQLSSRGSINFEQWKRIDGVGLESYTI